MTVDTIAKWREAIAYLTSIDHFGTEVMVEVGENLNECRVLDDNTLTIITPDTPTLESALDSVIALNASNQQIEGVKANADTEASSVPGWASWDIDTALAWHDTNITNELPAANLAEANAILSKFATENRALLQMVLALRNKTWPHLQE